jgi:hypothetical protein
MIGSDSGEKHTACVIAVSMRQGVPVTSDLESDGNHAGFYIRIPEWVKYS